MKYIQMGRKLKFFDQYEETSLPIVSFIFCFHMRAGNNLKYPPCTSLNKLYLNIWLKRGPIFKEGPFLLKKLRSSCIPWLFVLSPLFRPDFFLRITLGLVPSTCTYSGSSNLFLSSVISTDAVAVTKIDLF